MCRLKATQPGLRSSDGDKSFMNELKNNSYKNTEIGIATEGEGATILSLVRRLEVVHLDT